MVNALTPHFVGIHHTNISTYISGMNCVIRSSLYLLLLILDNIVSSDRVSVSSEVSQYDLVIIVIAIS